MKTRWASVAVVVALGSAALAGCGSSPSTAGMHQTPASPSSSPTEMATGQGGTALDRVVAASNAEVPKLMSMFGNIYSKIAFSGRGSNTLIVTYTYLKMVDPAKAKPQINAEAPVLQAACKANFFRALSAGGVSHPAAEYVWNNPDGSPVVTFKCAS